MIPIEQNTEKQLQRLSAQRQLYATAKNVFGWQVLLGGPIAVASALLVVAFPSLRGYAALWGILVSLSDVILFTPWQKRLREVAARVQELFDCDVLSLPWNELKAGKRPDAELVKEQAEKYRKWANRMPPLTNWYAPDVGDLPLYIGRIACQRSNCWWDSTQRRRYAVWVIGAVFAVFIITLWLSFGNGFTLEDFVLKVAAPLSPAFILGIRQFSEQIEAARRLDKFKDHAELLWIDALNGVPESKITQRSRSLQDEIFENRKRSPLVFETAYNCLRRDYEMQMNHGVAELVSEAKQKLELN